MASANQNGHGQKYWRGILAGLMIFATALVVYVVFTVRHHNFHVVTRGKIYRSGQMDKEALTECVRENGIKSILNLRGSNQNKGWYQSEIETAEHLRVGHYDFALASSDDVSLEKTAMIVELLRDAPKPLLIHCESGADRTGLVAAIYRYKIEGEDAANAGKELSIWYGHIPVIYPKVKAMDRSFWRYVSNDVFQAATTIRQEKFQPAVTK